MTAHTIPFSNDALGRTDFAQGLTRLITNNDLLPKGVIALDGEWGVGKTWFGEHLKLQLDQNGVVGTVWIDAFEADWDDDPALSLFAGIASQLTPVDEEAFLEKLKPYLLNLLPAATKAAFKIGSNLTGIDNDALSSFSEFAEKTSEKFVVDQISKLKSKRADLNAVKGILSDAVKDIKGRKLVIFVDELDRCSPGFAIRFLERLKHLFDVDGVVFILLWNRIQIQAAVEKFYGKGPHGDMYLDKFVDYAFPLPITGQLNPSSLLVEMIRRLCLSVNLISASQINESYFENFSIISSILQLTAREIKHVFAWFVLSNKRSEPILEFWLLGIKIKHPAVFNEIRQNKTAAHKIVISWLDSFQTHLTPEANGMRLKTDLVKAFKDLHNCHIQNNFTQCSVELTNYLHSNKISNPSGAINAALRRLETTFR